MKHLRIFLLILIICCPIFAETKKLTVHDVYQKRHWKIISYKNDSQGYSVLMKQIRHYLITKVNKGTIHVEVEYKFCDEYRYNIAKGKSKHKLTHQFFSKFGKDGAIEFPSEFTSDMKSINPYFENFMREMLGIPQIHHKNSKITKQKRRPWKYKPHPKNKTNLWTIQSINIYPSCIKLSFVKKNGAKRIVYMMEYSEKFFLMQKLLKKISSDELIKQYWTVDDYAPYFNFYHFVLDELGIDSKSLNYKKDDWTGITYDTIILDKLYSKNHPLKNAFLNYLKINKQNYQNQESDVLKLGCIYHYEFVSKYYDSFKFYFAFYYKNKPESYNTSSTHMSKTHSSATNVENYLKNLETHTVKTDQIGHSRSKFLKLKIGID